MEKNIFNDNDEEMREERKKLKWKEEKLWGRLNKGDDDEGGVVKA